MKKKPIERDWFDSCDTDAMRKAIAKDKRNARIAKAERRVIREAIKWSKGDCYSFSACDQLLNAIDNLIDEKSKK